MQHRWQQRQLPRLHRFMDSRQSMYLLRDRVQEEKQRSAHSMQMVWRSSPLPMLPPFLTTDAVRLRDVVYKSKFLRAYMLFGINFRRFAKQTFRVINPGEIFHLDEGTHSVL